MNTATLFQIQSLCILLLIYFGIFCRRTPSIHVKLMSWAIVWDIVLILEIELSRGAIAKASKAVTNPVILNIHVSCAVITVLLYFAMIFFGRKLLKGDKSVLKKHKILGWTTTVMRSLTFFTSFFATS
ncbi:MAG: hypothetical protein HOE90_14845 [Bacteriovoracaceae bacterium]|jgi:hypothetical protein|nr:hypothetical protein [Bacteriovoracaceae bacterium]